tara:strand:+ start:1161 stop:1748 length:588 start_codon:yes stop_codon:yes gene_type:complete
MKILFATHSKGKIKEFCKSLKNCKIFSLEDLNLKDSPEENGKTFRENAFIKARYWKNKIDKSFIIVSEDAGIEVDALGGRPGVHSARYAKTEKDANIKLLEELKNIPYEKRTARYISVFALIPNRFGTIFWKSSCEGLILEKEDGNNGFGYDPIFFSKDLQKPFGKVQISEKEKVSHRGKNLKKLQNWIDLNSKN